MTITGERARVLDFSSPYFDAAQAMVVKEGTAVDVARRPRRQEDRRPEGHHRRALRDRQRPEGRRRSSRSTTPPTWTPPSRRATSTPPSTTTPSSATSSTDNPELEVAAEFDTGEQYGMAVQEGRQRRPAPLHQQRAGRPQVRRRLRRDLQQVVRRHDGPVGLRFRALSRVADNARRHFVKPGGG